MHDIGKVAIPDSVLMKPGKLDQKEWDIVKMHPIYGEQILDSICRHAQAASASIQSYLNTARRLFHAIMNGGMGRVTHVNSKAKKYR